MWARRRGQREDIGALGLPRIWGHSPTRYDSDDNDDDDTDVKKIVKKEDSHRKKRKKHSEESSSDARKSKRRATCHSSLKFCNLI